MRERGDYPLSPKFPDAYLNREAQKAFEAFYELVADTLEGWWDLDGTVTTVANQGFIAAPADAWRVQAVDLVEGSCVAPLRRIGIGDRNRYGTEAGKPCAHRLSSRGIELVPPPDAAYTLKVYYTPKAPTLTENGAFEFVNGWDEYVIESGILRLDMRQERPIQERWALLFDPENGLKNRITRAANQRDQQEPQYLLLREEPPEGYY